MLLRSPAPVGLECTLGHERYLLLICSKVLWQTNSINDNSHREQRGWPRCSCREHVIEMEKERKALSWCCTYGTRATFLEQMEQYREACEQWADAQLEPSPAASKEAAEKGGSKATFKAKSSGKSNPLRAPVDHRLGFRSPRNGGRAAGRQTLRLAAHSLEQRLNTATGPCSRPQPL
jgi:hypothetical protein